MTTSRVGELITKVTAFGVAGWLAENAICGQDRYSAVFRGAKIPFMPIYAVNGVVLTAASSYVSKWPTLARGLAYSTLGTIVEYAGCQIDRHLLSKQPSWDYGRGDSLARAADGCISFTRSALWGGMGLIAEKVT
jgi:uncharacterized membrane protein